MLVLVTAGFVVAATVPPALQSARDEQDRAALQKIASAAMASAARAPKDATLQYQAALAASYEAEVALELHDKKAAEQAAEGGIKAAEQAVALSPGTAEYYRLLGTLYGQVIPANVLAGLSYGKKAKDAIDQAIAKDPRSSAAYMARGVGSYYLPASLGGGMDQAITEFRRALTLDAKNADAWLWLGLAGRKENKNAEARQAFTKSLGLNPKRIWAKQQLDKTPAQ